MSDRGPYDSDPDPTEVFPPLRNDPPRTPPSGLPPLGADRDPDPTRVMPPLPPTQGDIPTTAVPPDGGPYQPGPPYGGPPVGGGGAGGGGDEPPFLPEPDPWYRQPGPVAALIAGVAAVIVGIIALIVWTGGDDDGAISGDTLPPAVSTSSTTTTSSSVPDTTTTTTTTVPETTTTTSTTSTTTTTTTTTVPETTTTTIAPTTTVAPTTQPPPPPAGQAMLDAIRADADLSTFADALACTGLDEDVLAGDALTVLAPQNDAFADMGDPCGDPDAMESILLLHLVSVDLTYQQIFAASELQTLGELVTVSPNTQTIGSNESRIVERDVRAGDAVLQVLDKVIVP